MGRSGRKVKVFISKKDENSYKYKKVEDGKGLAVFHAWGCDYEEFETDIGNYSVAIVEREDGRVEKVCVSMIQFVEGDCGTSS